MKIYFDLIKSKCFLFYLKVYLKITEKGEELLERIIPSWENAMEEVNEIIGKDGEDALNKIHSKLIKS